MTDVVVADASVALKWVLTAEEWSPQAQALLETALRARQWVVAPPHLFSEVTNALHQRVRSRLAPYRISPEEAGLALTQFLAFPIEVISSPALYQESSRFAQTNNLPSLYDTLYVVLAQLLDAELWTADRRLVNTLSDVAPWVRYIGDYPLS